MLAFGESDRVNGERKPAVRRGKGSQAASSAAAGPFTALLQPRAPAVVKGFPPTSPDALPPATRLVRSLACNPPARSPPLRPARPESASRQNSCRLLLTRRHVSRFPHPPEYFPRADFGTTGNLLSPSRHKGSRSAASAATARAAREASGGGRSGPPQPPSPRVPVTHKPSVAHVSQANV